MTDSDKQDGEASASQDKELDALEKYLGKAEKPLNNQRRAYVSELRFVLANGSDEEQDAALQYEVDFAKLLLVWLEKQHQSG